MTWKVIWSDPSEKKRLKRFEQAKEAIAYAKELRKEVAKEKIHVVSATHAFPVPKRLDKEGNFNPKSERPSSRHLWCPYCIQWRLFTVSAIRFDGIRSPEAKRCPVCTISVEDFYVKKFNHFLGEIDEKVLYKGIVTMRKV